jgi:hypothetical protein
MLDSISKTFQTARDSQFRDSGPVFDVAHRTSSQALWNPNFHQQLSEALKDVFKKVANYANIQND